jgi:hypothetical protein
LRICSLESQKEDVLAESLGIDELEGRLFTPVQKELFAATHDDRFNLEPQLVQRAIATLRPHREVLLFRRLLNAID